MHTHNTSHTAQHNPVTIIFVYHKLRSLTNWQFGSHYSECCVGMVSSHLVEFPVGRRGDCWRSVLPLPSYITWVTATAITSTVFIDRLTITFRYISFYWSFEFQYDFIQYLRHVAIFDITRNIIYIFGRNLTVINVPVQHILLILI